MLKRILDGMPIAEAWLSAVWAYAEQKANNGEKILGYKLVQGREGNRKWADENEALRTLEIQYPQCIERRLLSPAKVEKLSKEIKELIKPLTTRAEGKIILVPESDPREVKKPQATEVFIEQEQDIFN